MNIEAVPVNKPADVNLILGQSHFIKTVEDLHEALVGSVPAAQVRDRVLRGVRHRLVRTTGNDDAARQTLAIATPSSIGARATAS